MARKPQPRPRKKQPFTKKGIEKAPEGPGVYEILKGGKIKDGYIGHSQNLKERLEKHKSEGDVSGSEFQVLKTDSTREAKALEKGLIKKLQPKQNEQGK